MASKSLLSLLLIIFSNLHFLSSSSSPDELVAELQFLRSQSESGVIHLDDHSISRFLTSVPTPRPYSLLIFFDAAKHRSNPDLHLPEIRSEFALVSSSFSSHNPSSSDLLFFCDLEFQESKPSFSLFGVDTLPSVRFVSPRTSSLLDSEPMDQSHFAGENHAESIAEFVESKTHLSVGPIRHRPPPLSTKQILFLFFIAAAALISSPYLLKKLIAGATLIRDPKFWMAIAVFIYFFSVSGAMYTVIRNMPMYLTDWSDDENRMVFFYPESGVQLGAEGFAVGFLYVIVGVMMALVTHVAVGFRSATAQRGFMLAAMVVGCWAVRKVVYLDNWKTEYSVHGFWPSSWK